MSFFCSGSSPASGKDDAVYIGMFENSLERALAHAVAQFLMLKSRSQFVYDDDVKVLFIMMALW